MNKEYVNQIIQNDFLKGSDNFDSCYEAIIMLQADSSIIEAYTLYAKETELCEKVNESLTELLQRNYNRIPSRAIIGLISDQNCQLTVKAIQKLEHIILSYNKKTDLSLALQFLTSNNEDKVIKISILMGFKE